MIKVQVLKNIGSKKSLRNPTFVSDRFIEESIFEFTVKDMGNSRTFLKELLIEKLSITCLAEAYEELVTSNCAVEELHGPEKTLTQMMSGYHAKEIGIPLLIKNLLEENSSIEILVKLDYFDEPCSGEGEYDFSSYSLFIDELQDFKNPKTNFESLRNRSSKIPLISEDFMNSSMVEHREAFLEIETIEIHFRFNKKK
jgi:hypothetical protein